MRRFIWGPGRGYTYYELQICALCIRWVHLSGDHWRWKPWRRLQFGWFPDWNKTI